MMKKEKVKLKLRYLVVVYLVCMFSSTSLWILRVRLSIYLASDKSLENNRENLFIKSTVLIYQTWKLYGEKALLSLKTSRTWFSPRTAERWRELIELIKNSSIDDRIIWFWQNYYCLSSISDVNERIILAWKRDRSDKKMLCYLLVYSMLCLSSIIDNFLFFQYDAWKETNEAPGEYFINLFIRKFHKNTNNILTMKLECFVWTRKKLRLEIGSKEKLRCSLKSELIVSVQSQLETLGNAVEKVFLYAESFYDCVLLCFPFTSSNILQVPIYISIWILKRKRAALNENQELCKQFFSSTRENLHCQALSCKRFYAANSFKTCSFLSLSLKVILKQIHSICA